MSLSPCSSLLAPVTSCVMICPVISYLRAGYESTYLYHHPQGFLGCFFKKNNTSQELRPHSKHRTNALHALFYSHLFLITALEEMAVLFPTLHLKNLQPHLLKKTQLTSVKNRLQIQVFLTLEANGLKVLKRI